MGDHGINGINIFDEEGIDSGIDYGDSRSFPG